MKGHLEVAQVLQDVVDKQMGEPDLNDCKQLMVFTGLFTALGYLSKIDRKVSEEEISFVDNLMNEMTLDMEQRQQAKDLFRMGKQIPDIGLTALLSNLKNECNNNSKILNTLITILMQLAHLDGIISQRSRLAIEKISAQLGINKATLDEIESKLSTGSHHQKRGSWPKQDQQSRKDSQSQRDKETADFNHRDSKLAIISADLFKVIGYLAKIDGRISREEIKATTELMSEMELDTHQRDYVEDLFRRGKHLSETEIIDLINELKNKHSNTPELLNIFVMILMGIAYADGDMDNLEQEAIIVIAGQLDLDPTNLDIIHTAVCSELQNGRSCLDLQDAYRMLGVSDAASHGEIRKVYLNLLKTYHPDALQSKGLPREMVIFGQRLSQKFNAAYERIKTAD